MVFQEDSVFPWMTVEENIGYGLRLRSAPGPDVRRTVGGFIEKVGLTRFARPVRLTAVGEI
jgi:ABC-type proline/glycine betaine transport system ATPase subunit